MDPYPLEGRPYNHRNNISSYYSLVKPSVDLLCCKLLTAKVLLHELLICFCHRFKEHIPYPRVIHILWNFAIYTLLPVKPSSLKVDNIYKTLEIILFTHRNTEWSYLLSELLLHLSKKLLIAYESLIHLIYKDKFWNPSLLQHSPCLLNSYFYSSCGIYNYYSATSYSKG